MSIDVVNWSNEKMKKIRNGKVNNKNEKIMSTYIHRWVYNQLRLISFIVLLEFADCYRLRQNPQ